jgi:hypothetical protein
MDFEIHATENLRASWKCTCSCKIMSQSTTKKTVRQRSGIQSMPSMSVSAPSVSYPPVSSPGGSSVPRTVKQDNKSEYAPTSKQRSAAPNSPAPPRKKTASRRNDLVDDVRYIREIESRPDAKLSEEEKLRQTARMRERAKAQDSRERSKSKSEYPINVDWDKKKMKTSFISLLVWVYLISVIAVLIYAYLGRDVSIPIGLYNPIQRSIAVYDSETYAIMSDSTSQPKLIQALMSLETVPLFSCPDGSGSDWDHMPVIDTTSVSSSVTFQSAKVLTGTFCNQNNTRIGYCVRDETCRAISNMASSSPDSNNFGICTTPTGPRRNGYYSITSSFLETLSAYPLNTVIPVGIGFLAGLVWLIFAVTVPTFAPLLLPIMSVGGIVGLFVTWKLAILGGESDNFYILVYAGLIGLFVIATVKSQTRIGRILRIGTHVLSGEDQEQNWFPVKDARGDPVVRKSISILFFSALYPFIQGVCALCLLYAMASAIQVTEFTFSRLADTQAYVAGERWASYALGLSKTIAMGAFSAIPGSVSISALSGLSQSANCSFYDFVNVKAGVGVLAGFFFLFPIYIEHAARYQVGASCADWYFFGTRNYRPPESGPSSVGRIAFVRSMFNAGSRILSCGIVSQLTTSSAMILSGWQRFLANFIVSPIDALIYSFIGFLFLGLHRFQTRFGLVHSSMKPGPNPKPPVVDKNSAYMVRRVYGFRFAMPGDSPESRVLLVSGSLVSVGCGLITWAWTDYYQNFDSVAYLNFSVVLIVWLTGSAISRPNIIATIAILVDAFYPGDLNLNAQMAKNSVMGFIIVSAVTNCIIRTYIQILCAAVDSVVYCYAIETVKRKRIRSLKLDEMIHVDYMGDVGKVPPNTRLERIIVQCPMEKKPGQKLTVEVEGERYDITIPPAAKPGQDFEIAVPIPFNRVDQDEEEEVEEEDENELGPSDDQQRQTVVP